MCQVLLNAGFLHLRSHLRMKLDAGAMLGTVSVQVTLGRGNLRR